MHEIRARSTRRERVMVEWWGEGEAEAEGGETTTLFKWKRRRREGGGEMREGELAAVDNCADGARRSVEGCRRALHAPRHAGLPGSDRTRVGLVRAELSVFSSASRSVTGRSVELRCVSVFFWGRRTRVRAGRAGRGGSRPGRLPSLTPHRPFPRLRGSGGVPMVLPTNTRELVATGSAGGSGRPRRPAFAGRPGSFSSAGRRRGCAAGGAAARQRKSRRATKRRGGAALRCSVGSVRCGYNFYVAAPECPPRPPPPPPGRDPRRSPPPPPPGRDPHTRGRGPHPIVM